MDNVQRAKIFAPFQALSGLEYALRKKEKEVEYEQRKTLSEDKIGQIDRRLKKLKPGDEISVLFYSDGKYELFKGRLCFVDKRRGCLTFEDNDIYFEDVYTVRSEE